MKKRLLAFLAAAVIACAAAGFCLSAGAFDANDYDYSYDDSDWGGGWDWDDDDDDYSYSYSGSSHSSGGGGGDVGSWTIAVVVVIIVFVIIRSTAKPSKRSSSAPPVVTGGVRPANGGQGRNIQLPDRTAQIEQILKKDDPNFTADDFTAFAKNVYMDIQTAWCRRDLTPVRPVLHTNLYNTTVKQVQSKIDQGVIYHYESIAINTAYLTSFVRDAQFEYLTLYLNARFIDYQTDEKTGNILRGDKNTRWDFRYKMKFMRSVGVKTGAAAELGHNCPNCGAPLEIGSSGECPYCGSTVTTGLYSWVLSDFTTIRDDTKDDGIRLPSEGNA